MSREDLALPRFAPAADWYDDGTVFAPSAGQETDAGRLSRDVVEFRSDMIEVLEACETYFDNKSDADGDEPNREMILLSMVQAALTKASA